MRDSDFYGYIFNVLEYDLGDAAPYGYFREVLNEEFGNKVVSQSFLDSLSKLKIVVGEQVGNINDASDEHYNPGAYFLADIPMGLGDAHYTLYPSLLGNGWGDIAPYLGIAVSGFGFTKSEFDPKAHGLPEESYYRFVGEFIAPKSLKGFSNTASESLISHFLGLTARGFGSAILMCGIREFRAREGEVEEYLQNLWKYFLEAIQSTINEL